MLVVIVLHFSWSCRSTRVIFFPVIMFTSCACFICIEVTLIKSLLGFFCKQLFVLFFYFLVQDIIIVGYCSTVHVLERLVLVIFLDMLNSYITVHPFLVNKGWTSLFLGIWTALDI